MCRAPTIAALWVCALWSCALCLGALGCGPGEIVDDFGRPVLRQVSSKADEQPAWLKPMEHPLYCGGAVRGEFNSAQGAHLYRLPLRPGYEVELRFDGAYEWRRGAALAVYDAHDGELLCTLRNPTASQLRLTCDGGSSDELWVMAYAVAWRVEGSYELRATCRRKAPPQTTIQPGEQRREP